MTGPTNGSAGWAAARDGSTLRTSWSKATRNVDDAATYAGVDNGLQRSCALSVVVGRGQVHGRWCSRLRVMWSSLKFGTQSSSGTEHATSTVIVSGPEHRILPHPVGGPKMGRCSECRATRPTPDRLLRARPAGSRSTT
jgi:hypothetical protein